ncbi:DNA sulfur modification protein DndB [Vibrio parahaemolyticus]|uniref:DNA sulfur modification protein DndB n=1 Tax=Vibrio parahaemolyticus TaxID=670 RepID=A0A9Q3UJ54_VIBPH|nr:DNA sulfur modification protein DndB [Vibrio parahaemolyticus]EGQ8101917.1 DGQHR domain-containing protein [Vibrio parahaemolyticus]EGQ8548772.1 DGQHR domain-containing protein [Vibrio parahaemolyticus]EGQ9073803.1 DGQHR domain-containing protein [Vibrio parahaemolyticus]EGQ9129692.1 DGQHR domain-containing protein [Vibrio parahaemolyticus]EGQ9286449.1 DGQHR domain-containing protein [Vibrio parahaemolyticus]
MSEYCFEIPAVRGIQAGREFFTINAPFGVLQRLVAFDTGNVLSRSQRDVNPTRAKKVSQYIQENIDTYVLTSLTGVINERPEFIESDHANVGLLKVSMDSEILLFDGQHRTTGIIDAIKQNVDLRSHNIPLMLFLDMTLGERQQAFSDINGHTVKPSTSISDTYNQRDDLPKLVVEMANDLVVFEGLVDFERNVIGKNSDYLFPVKILKDATARLLGVKANAKLADEQREIARDFWQACAKPLLWHAFRNWEDSADEFRAGYISSHGVFLNALGVVGQCLLAQYGNVDKLADLSTLNIRRDSPGFVGRCIDEVTGNMLTNATAIKLTAIKMLCHVGCPVGPELQSLERQYFPDTEFPSALEVGASSEEASLNEVFDEVEHRSVHLYAGMVRDKWPDLTEAQIDNVCDQVEVVVAGFGETLESAKGNVQCMLTKMRKSSTVLATIRANYKKVVAE